MLIMEKKEDAQILKNLGAKESDIKNLFKIDNSFSMPGTAKESGTGLGLILCKEFIEKHGGKIWATSREGTGTVMYFVIRKYQEVPVNE